MYYFDEKVVRTRNGIQETIADVTFPRALPSSSSQQCPHCTRRFYNVRSLGVHRRVHQPNPDRSAGVRLRRTLVSNGVKTVPLIWDGNLIGRYGRMKLHHKTSGVNPTGRVAGTIAFELQSM